jgi:ribosomal-protein-alanine N-acetyltransferase
VIDAVVERLAGESDLDAVMAIEDASFHNPTARAWYEEELTRSDVCAIYVIRVPEASVAGYCALWRVADEIHINNLAVRPDLRRRGLGRRLLAGMLDAAAAAGVRRATLEVRRSNVAAIRLYEQAGFREAGVRRNYYTQPVEDALLLVRS